MNCEKCNRKTEIVDSRRTKSGMVRRRRECTRCGNRQTTYEITENDLQDMRDKLKSVDFIRRGLAMFD